MNSALVATLLVGFIAALLVRAARRPSPMSIEVVGESLTIDLGWRDGLLALHRRFVIPLEAIKGVAVAPCRSVPQTGLRWPGTGLPGALRAGSFGFPPQRDFWLVRRAATVMVIELEPGEPYRRIVLEVADPVSEVRRLRPVVGAYTGTF